MAEALPSSRASPVIGGEVPEELCADLTEETFTPHDVVLGKGNGINCLPGNQMFRSIINKYKPLYAQTPRNVKGSVAELVINEISALEPPGRFLEPQADNKRFKEVPRKRAIEKTCQALREKKNNASSHAQTSIASLTRKVSLTVASMSETATPDSASPSSPPQEQHQQGSEAMDTTAISGTDSAPNELISEPGVGLSLKFSPKEGTNPSNPLDASLEQDNKAIAVLPNATSDSSGNSEGVPGQPVTMATQQPSPGSLSAGGAEDSTRTPMEVSESLEDDSSSPKGDVSKTDPSKPVWPLMDNDVLYGGRGRKHFHRVANQRFLDLIKYSRQEYQTSRSKKRVALGIITNWRRQTPPGRFLQQNAKDNKWYEIAQSKILEKTCQALRDLKRERGPGGVRPTIADRMVDPRMVPSDDQQSHAGQQPQQPHPQRVHPASGQPGAMQHYYPPPPHGPPPHHPMPPHPHWNVPPSGPYPPPQGMMYGNSYMPHPAMAPPPSNPGIGHHNNNNGSTTQGYEGGMAPSMMYNGGYMSRPMPPGAAPNGPPPNSHIPYGAMNGYPPPTVPIPTNPGSNAAPSTGTAASGGSTDGTERTPTPSMMYASGYPPHPPQQAPNMDGSGVGYVPTAHPGMHRGNPQPANDPSDRGPTPSAMMYGPAPGGPGHHAPSMQPVNGVAPASSTSPPDSNPTGSPSDGDPGQGNASMPQRKSPSSSPLEVGGKDANSGTNAPSGSSNGVSGATGTQENSQHAPPSQSALPSGEPTKNPVTGNQPPPHHNPEAVAAIQRQASIVAQEMQKMDELVRRASSSGVYVPPTGYGPPPPLAAPPSQTPSTSTSPTLPETAAPSDDNNNKDQTSEEGKKDPISSVADATTLESAASGNDSSRAPQHNQEKDASVQGKEESIVLEDKMKDEISATLAKDISTEVVDRETNDEKANLGASSTTETIDKVDVKETEVEEEKKTDENIKKTSGESSRLESYSKEKLDNKNGTNSKDGKKDGDPRIRGELEAAALLANMFGK